MLQLSRHARTGWLLAVSLALVSGCDDSTDSQASGAVKQAPVVITDLNRDDPKDVYSWALGVCRDAPLEALGPRFKTAPNQDAIQSAIGPSFPAATAAHAVAGCKAGFEKRRLRDGAKRAAGE